MLKLPSIREKILAIIVIILTSPKISDNVGLISYGLKNTSFDYLEKYLSLRIDKKKLAPTMRSLERMFLRTYLTRNEVALLKSLILNPNFSNEKFARREALSKERAGLTPPQFY
ncbi:MAG: hypothetical protein Q8O30_06850 [Candidatus Omnitrophota bacterium]|nr:hypothetical protein [Candidatus Omnitrophota bacterium]